MKVDYKICEKCGCYKSSERCYNCDPLKMGDLDCCDQLREYYGLPAKSCPKEAHRAPDLNETNKTHTNFKNDGRTSPLGRNPYHNYDPHSPNGRNPNAIIQHHLLEYYFTSSQLKQLGLYENAPQWQLLNVKYSLHHKNINGLKLHKWLYKDQWQNYKNLTETQIRALIDQIPQELINTFKAE